MALKRFSYSAEIKSKVIQFAKVNGNRAAERKFGPPPTEKIRDWLQEETLLKMPRQKKAMRGKSAKWPNLEGRQVDIKSAVINCSTLLCQWNQAAAYADFQI